MIDAFREQIQKCRSWNPNILDRSTDLALDNALSVAEEANRLHMTVGHLDVTWLSSPIFAIHWEGRRAIVECRSGGSIVGTVWTDEMPGILHFGITRESIPEQLASIRSFMETQEVR